ncbi:MAG: phosphatidate cytidylyltransferase [Bacteroidota bacterium]
MNNLLQRILTALVAGSVAIGAIYYHAYGLLAFCAIVSMVGLWEFMSVMGVGEARYKIPVMMLGGAAWIVAFCEIYFASAREIPISLYVIIFLCLLPLIELIALFNQQEKEPVHTLGTVLLAFVYCFLPILLLFKLAMPEQASVYDPMLPLGILLLTWVLDSGAYFAGRFLGKNPLFPRISPKKTWEGAIGGVILTLGLAWVLQTYHAPEGYSWWVIAAIISVFSQLGDLVESMFKRSVQLKDSGSILPGHGGMLDRFDGVYLSVPFIFFYFYLL